MTNALSALRAAAERKAAAENELAAASADLNEAIRAAIKSPEISTAEIREITGLSNARVYQINKG